MKTTLVKTTLATAALCLAPLVASAAEPMQADDWMCLRSGTATAPPGELKADQATKNMLEKMREGSLAEGMGVDRAEVQVLPGNQWICSRESRHRRSLTRLRAPSP
jgi:hypothetical protein